MPLRLRPGPPPLALRDDAAARIVVVVVVTGPQRSAMMQPFVTRLSGEGQRMEPARRRVLEPMNERHQPWVAVCVMCVWERPPLRCRLCVLRGPEPPTVRVRGVCVGALGDTNVAEGYFSGKKTGLCSAGHGRTIHPQRCISNLTDGSAFEPKPGTAPTNRLVLRNLVVVCRFPVPRRHPCRSRSPGARCSSVRSTPSRPPPEMS